MLVELNDNKDLDQVAGGQATVLTGLDARAAFAARFGSIPSGDPASTSRTLGVVRTSGSGRTISSTPRRGFPASATFGLPN